MRRTVPIAPALLLAAGPAVGQTAPPVVEGTLLTVSAQGRAHRTPDLATVRAGVVAQAPTAAAAMVADPAAMDRALAALQAAGVPPREVATTTVSLQPQHRYEEGRPPEVAGHQAVNAVSVRLRDLAGAGRVLDALVAAGVNQIEGPGLSSADRMARPTRRGPTRSAGPGRGRGLRGGRRPASGTDRVDRRGGESTGGLPIPALRRVASVAAAPTPVLAGDTEVTATVQVRFVLR